MVTLERIAGFWRQPCVHSLVTRAVVHDTGALPIVLCAPPSEKTLTLELPRMEILGDPAPCLALVPLNRAGSAWLREALPISST